MTNTFYPLLAVFGGTFDPVHQGHLVIAQACYDILHPESGIRFVPCKMPVHKLSAIDPKHRIAMLELALKDYPYFAIDRCEVDRSTPSYAVETVHHFRKLYPNHALVWIIGSDAYAYFTTWEGYQDILKTAHLMVVPRPNVVLPSEGDLFELTQRAIHTHPHALHQQRGGVIYWPDIAPIAVCATDIRSACERGKRPAGLSDPVWNYIQQHALYTYASRTQ